MEFCWPYFNCIYCEFIYSWCLCTQLFCITSF